MTTPPPNQSWTPDRLLAFLGRSGVKLDLLDCGSRKEVIASVGDSTYRGRPGRLRQLAWTIRTDQKTKGT